MGIEKSRDPTMQAMYAEQEETQPLDRPPAPPAKLYSSKQIGVNTFFFGPIAAMFCLKHNFNALERRNTAQQVVAGSLVYTLLMAVVLYFLPEDFPGSVIPAVNLAIVLSITHSNGMKTEDLLAAGHSIEGWGKTIGVGITGLLIFIAVFVGVVMSIEQILGAPG